MDFMVDSKSLQAKDLEPFTSKPQILPVRNYLRTPSAFVGLARIRKAVATGPSVPAIIGLIEICIGMLPYTGCVKGVRRRYPLS